MEGTPEDKALAQRSVAAVANPLTFPRIIPFRSRRMTRSLKVQAAQHGLAGLLLVGTGLEALRQGDGSFLLPIFEVLSGGVLFAAVVRELRARHVESGISWVDLLAGVMFSAEALHRMQEGSHGLHIAYFGAALLSALRGLLNSRISRRRRLELTSEGFSLRAGLRRNVGLNWKDIRSSEEEGDVLRLALTGGRVQRVDFSDALNGAELREALLAALARATEDQGMGHAALTAPPLVKSLAAPAPDPIPPPEPDAGLVSLTRAISPRLADCELSFLTRSPIDLERAEKQHEAYERALEERGCRVRRLPGLPESPDGVFVEDTAVVLDEVAVLCRPGADSRRSEVDSTAGVLREYRGIVALEAPAALDGGDVLRLGRNLFVGKSRRSNAAGVEQLRSLLAPFGYGVEAVDLRDCLHLKSAVTQVGEAILLINHRFVDRAVFGDWQTIEVDPSEPHGANALWLRGAVLYPEQHPLTRRRMETAGLRVLSLDLSELAKAEGGVTCCSLVFPVEQPCSPGGTSPSLG